MFIHHPLPVGLTLRDSAKPPEPSAEVLAQVEAIWQQELAKGRTLFNGQVFSLERFEGHVALGFPAPYTWYVAQLAEPALTPYLKVRSLGVSGLVIAQGHVLFGRRHPGLALEGGLWELPPAGTIHGGLREADGSVSFRLQFQEELREELGLTLSAGQAALPFALVEDTVRNIWDVGMALRITVDPQTIARHRAIGSNDECTELVLVPEAEVAAFVQDHQDEIVGIARQLLWAYGLTPEP